MSLTLSADQFLAVTNLLPDPLLLVSATGEIVAANQALGNCLLQAPETLHGKPLADYVADRQERITEYLSICSQTTQPCLGALTLRRTNGETILCRVEGALLLPSLETGPATLQLRFVPPEDATEPSALLNTRLYERLQEELAERWRVEQELQTAEERFRFALANSDIAVYMMDRDLRYTWVYNGKANAELPYLYGKTDADILEPEDATRLTEIKRRVLQTGSEEQHVTRATYRGQESAYYDTLFAPLRDEAGDIVGITGTVRNVTERQKAQNALAEHQAQIEALNARLQRAMRETHHRVKNNLQVITALLNLQMLHHESAVPVSELQKLSQHIQSLAMIHDLLTQQARRDTEVSDISVKDALEKLLPTWRSMSPGHSLEATIEDVRLPVRHTTSLAVLVNELISNSLKHGAGQISLCFRVYGKTACLEMMDEGPGFPADFNASAMARTGLELIESTARWDLLGQIVYGNRAEGGARVVIEFPIPAR